MCLCVGVGVVPPSTQKGVVRTMEGVAQNVYLSQYANHRTLFGA